MERTVTLVDAANQPLGECAISMAHQSPGKLHRAFSVYVFTPDGRQLLLQRRHSDKLFGGTWANTCCSHPYAGEHVVAAGQRRLREELALDCSLRETGALVYQAEDPAGRGAENEYDVLLVGTVDPAKPIQANPTEVAAWKWAAIEDVLKDMQASPMVYAPWFHLGLQELIRGNLLPGRAATPA